MAGLLEALRARRVIVCLGPGGVGKTTIAAAIGLRAAMEGRRVLVLTIDPAKRLMTALGLSGASGGPRRVGVEALAAAGLELPGEITAEMLDTRRAIDALIQRGAPDPQARARLEQNPLLRRVADVVSGAHTWLAMERLAEVTASAEVDLVVLDTPPSAGALDFLEAPRRIVGALDAPLLRALAGGGGNRLVRRLAALTGAEIFQELGRLLAELSGMFEGFRENAEAVGERLRAPDCALLVLCAPTALAVAEAAHFRERLARAGLPLAGFVVNGVEPPVCVTDARDADRVAARLARWPGLEGGGAADRRALAEALLEQAALAGRRRAVERALLQDLPDTPRIEIPRLDRDVHDLRGLSLIATSLGGEALAGPPRATGVHP